MTSACYQRSTDVIFSTLDDDVVALHIPKGRCYGMEQVSARVWELLAQPSSLDGICRALMAEFDVEHDECRNDIAALLTQFIDEGLAEIVRAE